MSDYYTKVIVFRRGEDGTCEVWEPAEVPNKSGFKPPIKRVFLVPDFPGDSANAKLHAEEVAKSLAQA